MRKRVEIDLNKLEALAARGEGVLGASLAFGLSSGTLYNRLRDDEAAKAAWRRGLAAHEAARAAEKSKAVVAPADKPKRKTAAAAPPEPDEREERVKEAIGAGHRSRRQIKDYTGLSYAEIEPAIYQLESVRKEIYHRENRAGVEMFYLTGEEAEAEEFSPPPPPPVAQPRPSSQPPATPHAAAVVGAGSDAGAAGVSVTGGSARR